MEWNETICEGYRRWLVSREKSKNTVSAYVRGVRKLARFIGDGALCHDAVLAFREALVETGYKPTTVNATLCAAANLPQSKVYPHNLRRLFSCCFYELEKDIVKPEDLLGHTNVETTRIYLQTSGEDHLNQLESMQLVT